MLCELDEIISHWEHGQPNKDSRLVDTKVYHSVVQADGVHACMLYRSSILSSELEFPHYLEYTRDTTWVSKTFLTGNSL